jgi:predicted transposase/invertase (TIGR01784 family)
MPISKYLDPKNDIAFKRIFGQEKNKAILIHFLNDVLEKKGEEEIKDVTFLSPFQDPELFSKKQSIVDVLCKDEKGVQYIVEMQVARAKGFEKRAQYYAAKAYVSQMVKGGDYEFLKEVIFLAITDFVMFEQKEDYKTVHVILDQNDYIRELKDFSFTFIELPKFKKKKEDLSSIEDKWCFFFKTSEETDEKDLQSIIGSDEIIKEAYEELDRYNWSTEDLQLYESEKKREWDEKAVEAYKLEEAEKKGAKKKLTEVARNMLSQNLSINVISQVTGFTEEEIQALNVEEEEKQKR